MKNAIPDYEHLLNEFDLKDPVVPIISCVDTKVMRKREDLVESFIKGITSKV